MSAWGGERGRPWKLLATEPVTMYGMRRCSSVRTTATSASCSEVTALGAPGWARLAAVEQPCQGQLHLPCVILRVAAANAGFGGSPCHLAQPEHHLRAAGAAHATVGFELYRVSVRARVVGDRHGASLPPGSGLSGGPRASRPRALSPSPPARPAAAPPRPS